MYILVVEKLHWKEAVLPFFFFGSGSVHFISIPGIIIVAKMDILERPGHLARGQWAT